MEEQLLECWATGEGSRGEEESPGRYEVKLKTGHCQMTQRDTSGRHCPPGLIVVEVWKYTPQASQGAGDLGAKETPDESRQASSCNESPSTPPPDSHIKIR